MVKSRVFFLICAVCAAIGILLRITYIPAPLTYDETFTVVTASPKFGVFYILKYFLIPDVHPPLYNLTLYLWNHIFPAMTKTTSIIPSGIFSLVSILSAWFLFPKYLPKTQKVIFFTLICISPLVIKHSFEVRSYSFMLMLSLFLTFLCINLTKRIKDGNEIKFKELAVYFILTAALSATHYFGSIVAGVYFIILAGTALKHKKYFWRFCAAYGLFLALFLPWLIWHYLAQIEAANGGWWGTSELVLAELINDVFINVFAGTLTAVFLAVSGIYVLLKAKKTPEELKETSVTFSFAAVVLTLFFCFLLQPKLTFFMGRFFTALLPCLFLLFSFVMRRAQEQNRYFMFVNAIILVSMLCVSLQNIFDYKVNTGGKAAAGYLTQNAGGSKNFYFYSRNFYPKKSEALVFGYYIKVPGAKVININEPEGLAYLKKHDKNALVWIPINNFGGLPPFTKVKCIKQDCFIRIDQNEK